MALAPPLLALVSLHNGWKLYVIVDKKLIPMCSGASERACERGNERSGVREQRKQRRARE